jgi:glycerol kinase
MKHILALDQSTSATKAILFDTAGGLVDQESIEHRQIYPCPGWVEHDAEEIFQNVLAAVRALAARRPDHIRDCVCMSIANQRETAVVFDKADGKPLHHAIVWQCRRGDPVCEQLREQGREPLVRKRTGLRLDTYFPAAKLKALIDTHDEIREQLEAGRALIGTIDAYLIYRLTNGASFVTDHTNACRTLCYDIQTHAWDEDLCSLFHIPTQALPSIIGSDEKAGATDCEGALPRELPLCGVMGDSHASLFAHRCFNPGMAKVTFGTGSSVLVNTGNTLFRSEGGAVSTLAWHVGGKPTYSLEGIISFSAATISWLKNQLGLIESAAETESLAGSVPDNGGVYIVPAFAGLSAPYWAPNARAGILGLSAHSARAHVARAALESIAYQIHDIFSMIASESEPLTSVHGDGGPTKNRFLMQFVADIAGLELKAAHNPNLSPLGAAMCGALGMGVYATPADIERLPLETAVYAPEMSRARATELYEGWRAAVRRVL